MHHLIENEIMEQHHAKKRMLIGLFIFTVGSLLLLRNIGIYDEFINEYIFRWEMILITFGIINMIAHEGPGPGLLLVLIGGGLYARNYIDLPSGLNFWQLFLASIFILAGLFMIFKRKTSFHCEPCRQSDKNLGVDTIDEIAFFGGGDRTIVSDNFKGGKILAIFGGSNFNLSRSKLAPGKNYIDVLAIFGGLKLVVPENWNVKISAISIFGGFSDKHRVHSPDHYTEDGPTLIIKGFLIFGGGEIKSY
jgi:predicted membrane protein